MTDDEYEELEQRLHDYKGLASHPGWKRYVAEVLEPQVKGREISLNTSDDDSLDGWGKSRRLIGERGGLKLAISLVDVMVEQLDEEVKDARRDEYDE